MNTMSDLFLLRQRERILGGLLSECAVLLFSFLFRGFYEFCCVDKLIWDSEEGNLE